MRDDLAIVAQAVSKKYRLFASKRDRVREALHPFRRTYHREFWALKDVSFEILKGQTVGILGMNGSGKSTLLQIIASVLQPTAGSVQVNGKVAALLELGAGFNPDLTGRENVMLNGTIMGLSRPHILDKLPEIEAFADIGEFFDQPMKTYSSGMFMRVAFSTALYVDPEVLIIDEALSVGDAKFQQKCFRRFRTFQEAGKTILFVTHDRSTVPRYCNLGLLLHKGELVEVGEPSRIVDLYGELLTFDSLSQQPPVPPLEDEPEVAAAADEERVPARRGSVVRAFLERLTDRDNCWQNPTHNKYEHRSGNGGAEIVDYLVMRGDTSNPVTLSTGDVIDVYLKVLFHRDVEAPIVGIILKNKEGVIAYGTNSEWMQKKLRPAAAGDLCTYCFTVEFSLASGDWFVDLAVAETSADICDNREALAYVYVRDAWQYVGLVRLETQIAEVHPAGEISRTTARA